MSRISIFVGLISLRLGGAIDAPCATIAPLPAAGVSTTAAGISCNTPLCQGLVGAGVGVAGLAAIGGIVAGVTHHGEELLHTEPPSPHPPTKAPPTKAPSPANTSANATTTKSPLKINIAVTTPSILNREREEEAKGSNWLLPLLIALLVFCCLLGIVGYLCMKPQKRTTKLKKKTAPAPAEPEEAPLIAPAPAPAPAGHWEQPMALMPELPAIVMPMSTPSYIV